MIHAVAHNGMGQCSCDAGHKGLAGGPVINDPGGVTLWLTSISQEPAALDVSVRIDSFLFWCPSFWIVVTDASSGGIRGSQVVGNAMGVDCQLDATVRLDRMPAEIKFRVYEGDAFVSAPRTAEDLGVADALYTSNVIPTTDDSLDVPPTDLVDSSDVDADAFSMGMRSVLIVGAVGLGLYFAPSIIDQWTS